MIDEDEEFQPQREVIHEMEVLKRENKILHDDLGRKSIVIEMYEAKLKRYRSQSFLEEDCRGVRRYSKELVEILTRRGQAYSHRLLEDLDIDPRETDLVKAVSKQLEELEGYGMIKAEAKGWRWIGYYKAS